MAFSSLQTRWWLEAVKLEEVPGQHLEAAAVLRLEDMLKVLLMLQYANVGR